MSQKKVFCFEYLNSIQDLYEYLKKRNDKRINLKFSDSVLTYKISRFITLKKAYNKFSQLGFYNTIEALLKKDAIVLCGGLSEFYKKLSDKVIFFDHGWGVKSVPGNMEKSNPSRLVKYRNILENTDYIICIQDDTDKYFLNCPELADIPRPVFLPLGMPRNDYIFNNADDAAIKNDMKKRLQIADFINRVILYAPTYREIEADNLSMFKMLMNKFDQIDNLLKQSKTALLFRPHYFYTGMESDFKKFTNIRYTGNNIYSDPRPLMICSDMLVTDYSSIQVDYLLLDKPIVLFPFDLDSYMETRGLRTDYNSNIQCPGPQINDLSDILDLTKNDFKAFDLEKSRKFFHKHSDGNSCRRIADFILDGLLKAI